MGMTILAGFTLAKKGLFPPAASRGASHLSMVSCIVQKFCLGFHADAPLVLLDNRLAMPDFRIGRASV